MVRLSYFYDNCWLIDRSSFHLGLNGRKFGESRIMAF